MYYIWAYVLRYMRCVKPGKEGLVIWLKMKVDGCAQPETMYIGQVLREA